MSLFKKLFKSKENNESDKKSDQTANLEEYKKVPWMTDLRLGNLSICLDAGFKPATSLPTEFDRNLRPSIEIAKRLNAIKAIVLWLMVPQENLENKKIQEFVNKNGLEDFLDEEEKEIFNTPRDDEEARNSIGWKFENAWPLAWYFGYTEPDIFGQMMSGEEMQVVLTEYTCPLDGNVYDWFESRETKSEVELKQKEDLFYCLHNAVRSAQLGSKTVPEGFHPMGNVGVIHERRHSLTWMLSKGVSWEETDLST